MYVCIYVYMYICIYTNKQKKRSQIKSLDTYFKVTNLVNQHSWLFCFMHFQQKTETVSAMV